MRKLNIMQKRNYSAKKSRDMQDTTYVRVQYELFLCDWMTIETSENGYIRKPQLMASSKGIHQRLGKNA